MHTWQDFWQAVSATSLFASLGTLFKMYSLGIQQAEQIKQIRKDLSEERDRNDKQDNRHMAAEIMLSRIDANVTELLQLRRNESRGRGTGGQQHERP